MLNADALSQLGALRQNLRGEMPRIQGQVLPSRQRTGFVLTDAGQRYLLSAEDMQKLLPGDRVECLVVAATDQPEAQLECVLGAQIETCVGRLLAHKGKRWVQLDHDLTQRRLAVSPKSLGSVELGSWVRCTIIRRNHDAPLAQIDALIAEPEAPFWLHQVALARFNRVATFSDEVIAQAAGLIEHEVPADYADLTDLAWVTIDQAKTQDMDDAIHVAATAEGWQVSVAIADASHWVPADSPLDQAAIARYASQYMPGWVLPMLPDTIGLDRCALAPHAERGALVLQAMVERATGRVVSFSFQFARVQSHAKLSYDAVNAMLQDPADTPWAEHAHMLHQAQEATQLLRAERQRACLNSPDRAEYEFELDAMGAVTAVHRSERGPAQMLVEELMLLTNHLAAEHLSTHAAGLFLQHAGFRDDRWPEVQQLLAPLSDSALTEPPSHAAFSLLLPKIANADPQLSVLLSRHYCRSELIEVPKPHWGLGLASYTNVTSPIRRYLDVFLHRQLKAIWRAEPIPKPSAEMVQRLASGHDAQRSLERFVSRWLYTQWMAKRVGETFAGEVQHLMPAGCLVHLDEVGCTGFVPLRSWQDEQAQFDPVLMCHHLSFGTLELGDSVQVKLQRVDQEQRQMTFELVR